MEEVAVSNYPVISVVFISGIFKDHFAHTPKHCAHLNTWPVQFAK